MGTSIYGCLFLDRYEPIAASLSFHHPVKQPAGTMVAMQRQIGYTDPHPYHLLDANNYTPNIGSAQSEVV
jgi:hypothetical protein